MFQSTHSLRSATLPDGCKSHLLAVSIHALLAECDNFPEAVFPHGKKFQSTHSLRSATKNADRSTGNSRFQSTHSLRSATPPAAVVPRRPTVSIHALLAECDRSAVTGDKRRLCFNPRTPCGVRPVESWGFAEVRVFQSTHSLRSATFISLILKIYAFVSIHALLAECDRRGNLPRQHRKRFNPRTPCGVRHQFQPSVDADDRFQSTHSLRSATLLHCDVTVDIS